jgi:NAD(P)-dependent dehydrogenase (short-subunit alcohol dehydrogenase family)
MEPTVEANRAARLSGKVAVVTGGASGIGLAITERLIAEGAQFVIFDISDPIVAAERLGENALGLAVDAANEDNVIGALGSAVEHFGKLDIVAQHPVGHLGQPNDVAAAVVFLASDDARFITGAELAVDGGYTAI